MNDTAKRCSNWLWCKGCTISELDGETFVIVPSWDVVNHKRFRYAVQVVANGNYGFEDEYTTCSECGKVIATNPDSYSWQPDFIVTDGEILCKDCIRENAEWYLEYQAEHNVAVNKYLVNPADYGFIEVISGCQSGMHPHQNEDPRKVARWAKERGYQVVFTASNGQFDVVWDAWFRASDDDGYRPLTDEEVEAIRKEMVQDSRMSFDERYDYLKEEFKA